MKPTKAQLVIYTGESENEMVIFPSSKKPKPEDDGEDICRSFDRRRKKPFARRLEHE